MTDVMCHHVMCHVTGQESHLIVSTSQIQSYADDVHFDFQNRLSDLLGGRLGEFQDVSKNSNHRHCYQLKNKLHLVKCLNK